MPPSNETVNDPGNNTVNWLGLYKATADRSFPVMIDGYMCYLVLVTLYTIICLRLKRHRFLTGKPMTRPKVIFPDITRDLADKCLGNMLKYLVNFVFYKFGIELTYIMLVVLIGHRMDMVALVYVGWLCMLFRSDVACQKRVWPYFRVFIIALTLLQYVAAVGLPPFLCIGECERKRRVYRRYRYRLKFCIRPHRLRTHRFGVLAAVAGVGVAARPDAAQPVRNADAGLCAADVRVPAGEE